jgi:hypothetical protein
MARVNGGIESKISGMVGPVVFVNFNGKTYVRQAPRARGKNGWSDNQVNSRQRFSKFCSFWSRSIPGSMKQIWGLAAEGMNGFNLFLKVNLPAFGADGTLADWDRFHFTQGNLPLSHKLKVARIPGEPDKIAVSWQNDSETGLASSRDELVMITSSGINFSKPINTGAIRKAGAAVIQLQGDLNPVDGISLYFMSPERNLYSVDQYFGLGE